MKKTFISCLFASTLLCGCVAQREISVPLSQAPTDYVEDDFVNALPQLPAKINKVQYIDINEQTVKPTPLYELVEKVELVPLQGLSSSSERIFACPNIYNVWYDDGLFFIRYRLDSDEFHATRFGIFSRKGEKIAELGVQLRSADGGGHRMPEPQTNEEYASAQMAINRRDKEVALVTWDRIVVYDYKGQYKRTEFPRYINTYKWTRDGCSLSFLNTEGTWVALSSTTFRDCIFYDKQSMKPYAWGDRLEYQATVRPLEQVDDGLYFIGDTIWQMHPKYREARYVYRGQSIAYDRKMNQKDYQLPKNVLYARHGRGSMDDVSYVSDRYVMTQLYTQPFDRALGLYHLYDARTGRSTSFVNCMSIPDGLTDSLTFEQNIVLDNASLIRGVFPDGTLALAGYYPQDLKQLLAMELERPKPTIKPEMERLIRNLKLDDGPVLVLVRLKEF